MKKQYSTTSKNGFSLLNVIMAMVMISIITAAAAPNALKKQQSKLIEAIALDIANIQDASRAYYLENNTWPTEIADLQTNNNLPSEWSPINAWGFPYTLTDNGPTLTVETTVPPEWTKAVESLTITSVSGIDGNVSSTIAVPGASAEGLPSNLIVMTDQAGCPEGFEQVTTLNGKFLTGGNTFNINAGGSNTINGTTDEHVLTVAEMPSHSHGYLATPWTGSRYDGRSSPLMTQQVQGQTDSTGGNQGHSHGLFGIDNRPEFATVVLCKKL